MCVCVCLHACLHELVPPARRRQWTEAAVSSLSTWRWADQSLLPGWPAEMLQTFYRCPPALWCQQDIIIGFVLLFSYHLDDAKISHQVAVLLRLQLEELQSDDGEHHLENTWKRGKEQNRCCCLKCLKNVSVESCWLTGETCVNLFQGIWP